MPPIQITYTFETEDELRAHLGTIDTKTATPAAAPDDADDDTSEPTRTDVDADGMPYDESVHSDPPKFTAKGLWKAQRGKADEAQAARDAFKAGGATETAPEDVATRDAAPEPDAGLPSLPGGDLPAPAAPPVTYADFVGRLTELFGQGKFTQESVIEFYKKHTKATGDDANVRAVAGDVLKTNETVRAAAMADLNTM